MSVVSILNPTAQSSSAPFRGFPKTWITVGPDGRMTAKVAPTASTPLRARLSLYGGIATGLTMFGAGTVSLIGDGTLNLEAVGTLFVSACFTGPAAWYGLYQLSKKRVVVTLTPERIHVRKTFASRSFERSHPHGFALLWHDKAEKEQDRHAFLERKRPPKWWSWRRKKYYGDSYHVVLQCFGERYDILTVYGRKRAEKIHARLQACDTVAHGAEFGDSGVSLSPDADWGVEAGGL